MKKLTLKNFPLPVVYYTFDDIRKGVELATRMTLYSGIATFLFTEEKLADPAFPLSDRVKDAIRPYLGSAVLMIDRRIADYFPEEELTALLHHSLEYWGLCDKQPNHSVEEGLQREIEADRLSLRYVSKNTLRRVIIRMVFLISQRTYGEGEQSTMMAKAILKDSVFKDRIHHLR